MCLACLEYIKGGMQFNEFKGAMREAAEGDPEHYEAVQEVLRATPDENAVKQKLKNLQSK